MKSIPVKDIMVGDVAYVDIPGNREEVLETLKKRQVSGVPVVKKGQVVGMVTRTDLLRNPEEDQIALLMTRDPVTVGPQDPVIKAAGLLSERGIRRLPVVEDGRLVGMVTVADVLKVVAEQNIEDQIERHFQRKIAVLWDEMPLPIAGSIMEYAQVGACPVLDSELKLVGMISDRDLINASVIEDSTAITNMSAGQAEDAWMWDRIKHTLEVYYAVSKIQLKNIRVRDAMVPPITAIKSRTVSECAALMRKNRIDQIPVVTSSQNLSGLLRDRDVITALIKYSEHREQ